MDAHEQNRRDAGDAAPVQAWSSGHVARAALVLVAVYALAAMLWMARDVIFVAFFAALLAAFLSVFVDPLQRRGAPRALAAVTVLVALAVVIFALIHLAWPTLQDQIPVIRRELPNAIERVREWLVTQYDTLLGNLGQPTTDLQESMRQRMAQELTSVIGGALPLLTSIAGAVAGALIVLFAGLYLAIDPSTYAQGLARLIPPRGRARVAAALDAVGHALRMWMVGTLINMVIIGTLTTIGLMVLGVPAAFALGLIAGLLEFIPTFGPILSAVPAIAIAFVVSPTHVLWVILLYVATQQLEGNLISPLVMKRAVQLPPALTILVQALMAVLFGFLGLLVAVPLLATVMVFVRELYVEPMEAGPPPPR